MTRRAIVDAGPLVAFLDRSERHHPWIEQRLAELEPPLLTCEAVLAEAMHLLAKWPKAQDALLGLMETGALSLAFRLEEHVPNVRRLMARYRDTPMSLADACLVCMAEKHDDHAVLTLDSDFLVYRKHGRTPIDILWPEWDANR